MKAEDEVMRRTETDLPAGVEDGLVVEHEDVHAVDVAAAGGDAFGELGHDAHRVGALEEVDARRLPAGTAAESGRRAKDSILLDDGILGGWWNDTHSLWIAPTLQRKRIPQASRLFYSGS
jgi:hypothetical protein